MTVTRWIMTEEQEEIHRSCHAQTDIPNYKINIPISHRCNHVILTWESIQLEFICEEETFINNFYSNGFKLFENVDTINDSNKWKLTH